MRCVGKVGVGEAKDFHGGVIQKMKGVMSRKKDAHKMMCRSSTEENHNRYKSMKNKAKEVVSKAMTEKAE